MPLKPYMKPVFPSRSIYLFWLVLIIPALLAMACNFSSGDGNDSSQQPAATDDSQLVAQSVQLTLNARQPTQAPTELPTVAPVVTEAPIEVPTEAPTEETVVETPPPVIEIPTPEVVDIETQIQNANILLYEDAGAAGLKRYVKEALDRGGYSYTDVAGEIGRFKAELNSGVEWDLIISSAESRSFIEGEFFEYLNDSLNDGGAVIIELWYLDEILRGKVSSIMDRCGFRLQKDWKDPDKDSRSIFWLQPDHPLLSYPNSGISLVHYGPYWLTGDVGDLLASTNNSNGVLVGGNVTYQKNSYGLVGVCDDGRLVLQTFSSHDYQSAQIINLWENYIYYTLENHFLYINN
ncbi:MAG: PT domain-containing protein [Anaerolineaceae bacterium]